MTARNRQVYEKRLPPRHARDPAMAENADVLLTLEASALFTAGCNELKHYLRMTKEGGGRRVFSVGELGTRYADG